jgi:CDP-2,3-bis-(O-geranylgeranyl)-sn-glycerol synthase
MLDLILEAFIYYLPAYFVNGGMLVYGFFFPPEKDLRVSTKLFGPNKTFGGLLFAIACGGIVGLLVSSFWLGVFLGIGTWIGTLGGGFLKRRLGIKPSDSAPIIDQLDFVFGATLLGYFILPPKIEYFLIILFLTPPLHKVFNILAYKMGIKNVAY